MLIYNYINMSFPIFYHFHKHVRKFVRKMVQELFLITSKRIVLNGSHPVSGLEASINTMIAWKIFRNLQLNDKFSPILKR